MKSRITISLLFALALVVCASGSAQAQRPVETDDEYKVTTYRKFVDNREPNPAAAYQAAREYMARYGKEVDDYTKYLREWISAFERDERQDKLLYAIYGEKNYNTGYGLAKQVLVDDPDNVKVLIALGYGGYLATTNTRTETFNADAAGYARKAIQLIESGKSPDVWEPFKNKEDALASLNYAIGFTERNTQPEDAINKFIRVIQIDSDLRRTPSPYYLLAAAYEKGPYQKLSADYGKRFANQAETPESKAALETLNKVIDRIVDAYARAVATAGNEPQYQTPKAEWTRQMTTFYKFRHENSDAGLAEYVAGILKTPLPQP